MSAGEALEGFVGVSVRLVFCVVVVSWWVVWFFTAVWSCCRWSSCSIMMVPPPWAMSWSMRVDGGSGVPGMVGVGYSGLGIGR